MAYLSEQPERLIRQRSDSSARIEFRPGDAPRPRRPATARPAALADALVGAAAAVVGLRAGALGALVFAVTGILALHFADVFNRSAALVVNRLRIRGRILIAAVVCTWLTGLVAEPVTGMRTSAWHTLSAWAIAAGGWLLVHAAAAAVSRRRRQRTVILGTGVVAERVRANLERHAQNVDVVGFLADSPHNHDAEAAPIVGDSATLEHLAGEGLIDRVVVAFSAEPDVHTLAALRRCDESGVSVDIVPRMFELVGRNSHAYGVGGIAFTTVPSRGRRRLERAVKRGFDIVVSGVLLLATSPAFLAVIVAIRLEDGGPVFFRQGRVGFGGQLFRIHKFRSMAETAEQDEMLTVSAVLDGTLEIAAAVAEIKDEDDPRVTRVGAFLRRTSLDELPQLLDVLRGKMSLVGPRPLRPFEVESLERWEQLRQLERPGMTGLWQVTGRSDIDWNERMYLDYTYARHWSLAQDIEILARTIPAVWSGSGAR